MKQYELWMCHIPGVEKSQVTCGTRPVIVVSNDRNNEHSPVVTVVPVTSRLKKRYMPTHVLLEAGNGGLETTSMALCENVLSVDKTKLFVKLGNITEEKQTEIAKAISVQLNIL